MPGSLSIDSIVVAAPDQVWTPLADEVVILGMTDGIYYGLDPVGARIWRLVEQPIALRQVVESLVAEYDVEADRCAADVLVLAHNLASRGLLEVRNDRTLG